MVTFDNKRTRAHPQGQQIKKGPTALNLKNMLPPSFQLKRKKKKEIEMSTRLKINVVALTHVFGMFASFSLSRLAIPVNNAGLDNYNTSILDTHLNNQPNKSDAMDVTFSESDVGDDGVGDVQPPAAGQENKDIAEIVGELAEVVNVSMLSKFNISHNFLWVGTKRALSRKSFSPENKFSVKITDNAGASEGAVDLGGPMREFFTLALQYLHDFQVFCGSENCKFLSFQSKCLQDEDYHAPCSVLQQVQLAQPKPLLKSWCSLVGVTTYKISKRARNQ